MNSAKIHQSDSTKKEYMNIITSLMSFCVQGEHEVFCSTAVESLVKKLKGNREMMEDLYTAVSTYGATPTNCVTIQRTLDSRLQIAGKKCYPHVVTCKLWRWTDVVKNELVNLSCCEFAYQLKSESVCINPYHYKRTESPEATALTKSLQKNGSKNSAAKGAKKESKQNKASPPPNKFLNSPQNPIEQHYSTTLNEIQQQQSSALSEYTNIVDNQDYSPDFYYHQLQTVRENANATSNINQYNYQNQNQMFNYGQNYNNYEQLDDNQQFNYQELLNTNTNSIYPISSYEQYQENSPPLTNNHQDSPSITDHHQNSPPTTNHHQNSPATANHHEHSPLITNHHQNLPSITNTHQNLQSITNTHQNSQPITNNHQNSPPITNHHQNSPPIINHHQNSLPITNHHQNSPPITNTHQNPPVITNHQQNNYQITQLPGKANYSDNYSHYPNAYWNNHMNSSNNQVKFIDHNGDQLEHWCSINYYELKNLVGTFKVKSTCPMIRVDGYCEPDSDKRFCLGVLTNLERTEKSEKVRMSIGKGVCIEARANGKVYLKCETDVSIFLYSYFVDIKLGFDPGSKVHKLSPGEYLQIFDLNTCYLGMSKYVEYERCRMAATAAMVNGNSSPDMLKVKKNSDINVDYLREYCVIRMSFAKGWGTNYPKRNIKETPCWIEVSLHQALKLLDDILRQN